MKGYTIEDGSPVQKMIGVEITGNVIPLEWFKHIKFEKGKPHSLAIMILADIVYWFRPIEERDEITGNLIGYRKRFQADKLQRSYKAYADQYGYTKNQIKDAFDCLRNLGVIETEFRDIVVNGLPINNVMFIELKIDRLKEITHPLPNLNRPGGEIKPPTPPQFKAGTNTEITPTEITPETNPVVVVEPEPQKQPQPKVEEPLQLQPNIYKVYEQEIGVLTPMIADVLDDIDKTYPEGWFVEAVREAKKSSTRVSIKYVEKILQRWLAEGKVETKKNAPRPRSTQPIRIVLPDGSYSEAYQ